MKKGHNLKNSLYIIGAIIGWAGDIAIILWFNIEQNVNIKGGVPGDGVGLYIIILFPLAIFTTIAMLCTLTIKFQRNKGSND